MGIGLNKPVNEWGRHITIWYIPNVSQRKLKLLLPFGLVNSFTWTLNYEYTKTGGHQVGLLHAISCVRTCILRDDD